MGLSDWINRNIVEYQAQDPAPKPEDPPEERAKRVELVAGRPARELLGELPEPDFAGLENAPPAQAATPAEPPQVTLVEPAPEAAPLPPPDPLDDGGDPPVSVAQVYEAAHLLPPSHGFTLAKLAGMFADPRLANLDEDSRASAIAVVLETAGVKLETIVKEAASRDASLDRFEGFLATKLVDQQVETDKRCEGVRKEIEEFVTRKEAEIARAEERLEAKQVELARFRRVKHAEERRLLEVVRHFTKEPTISVGDEEAKPSAPSAPPTD